MSGIILQFLKNPLTVSSHATMISMEKRQRAFVISFNIYTIVLWGWYIVSFFTKEALHVPRTLVDAYLLILTYYAGDKEIHRWRHQHSTTRRRGEFFVAGWVTVLIMVVVIDLLGGAGHGYHMPDYLPFTVGVVVVIYLITRYLKTEFCHKR